MDSVKFKCKPYLVAWKDVEWNLNGDVGASRIVVVLLVVKNAS